MQTCTGACMEASEPSESVGRKLALLLQMQARLCSWNHPRKRDAGNRSESYRALSL